MTKISTDFIHPPILVRNFDWCACYDGEEERREYGWGVTEQAAVKDLKQNYPRCKNEGGEVGAAGECLLCDAEAGEKCQRKPL